MRRPQLVVHSIARGLHKERVVIACGTSKWNWKGVTVRPCIIWEVMSIVNKRVRHEDQTIQELITDCLSLI